MRNKVRTQNAEMRIIKRERIWKDDKEDKNGERERERERERECVCVCVWYTTTTKLMREGLSTPLRRTQVSLLLYVCVCDGWYTMTTKLVREELPTPLRRTQVSLLLSFILGKMKI